jgi:hypothetical protein
MNKWGHDKNHKQYEHQRKHKQKEHLKNMQKKSIMALEQLDHQKKGARRASWLWNN